MHRLFVDVGYELSEHQLRQHFTKYGAVSDVYLPKHSMGRNKGYAFVTFSSEHALSSALLDSQPVVNGIKLKVKRATPRPPGKNEQVSSPKTPVAGVPSAHVAKVLVEGLAAGITEAQVQQHFAKWGPVAHVSLCPTQQGQDCIVTFVSHADAKRACDQSERFLAGWALKSIRLVTQDSSEQQQQHHSLSPSSEASHVISNRPQLGQFNEVTQTPHMPLGLPDFAQAQLLLQLRAANPSAFAAWLHLERLQQQLLAEYPPTVPAPQPPQQATNPIFSQANGKQVPSPTYLPPTPVASLYNVPYSQAGHPVVSSPSQQYLDSVLSKLYSQTDQPSSGPPSLYSQSGPVDNAYIQPHPHPHPTALYDGALPYSQGLTGPAPGLNRSQNGSVNHLSTLAQQAMAAAGSSGGSGGYMEDAHQAEPNSSGGQLQDHVQSKYSFPRWSPF